MRTLQSKLRVEQKSWDEIIASIRPDDVILLDLDGVLAADADAEAHPSARVYVQQLTAIARVLLVTNTPNRARAQACAVSLGIPLVTSAHRKPSARILEAIEHTADTSYVVIGDKFSTDVLFAYAIGGRSYLLKDRLRNKNDRLVIKLSYLLDDALSALLGVR